MLQVAVAAAPAILPTDAPPELLVRVMPVVQPSAKVQALAAAGQVALVAIQRLRESVARVAWDMQAPLPVLCSITPAAAAVTQLKAIQAFQTEQPIHITLVRPIAAPAAAAEAPHAVPFVMVVLVQSY